MELMLPNQRDPRNRTNRRPMFPVAGTVKPFGLYPVCVHPVLPGETLQSFNLKTRTISMPIKNPVAGAWLERWLCYVKLTDMGPELAQSFVDDNQTSTSYERTTDSQTYFTKTGQVDWIKMMVDRIAAAYFRDETAPVETVTIDGVPRVKHTNKSWFENLAHQEADATVPTNDAHELYKHLQDYQVLQQMSMTEMTFEKYLEKYGVSTQSPGREGDPEILAYSRDWTLPTNHVEPTDGSPSSAWVWGDDFTMNKAKRFTEPGFVIVLQCVRPKVFNDRVRTSLVGNLWGFSDWYPIYTLNDPTAGIKEMSSGDAVFETSVRSDSGDVTLIYDHRDLLMNGEQFVNDYTNNPYDYPTASVMSFNDADLTDPETVRGEYPFATEVDAMFTGATEASRRCYYDGAAFMTISGHVDQSTPLR